MKHINKIILSVSIVLLLAVSAQAQDTRFSQPLNNQMSLNPAMMALSNDFRINLNYRNQWASIDKGYSTYAISLMYPLFLKSGGAKGDTTRKVEGKSRLDFGVNVTDDKQGLSNRINATFSIAYSLKLNPSNSLTAALNFGYYGYQGDVLHMSFDEQFVNGGYDARNPNGESLNLNKGAADVGFGFMYHYSPENSKVQAFAGLAGYHLNQPNLSLLGGKGTLPARFNFQAGVKIIGKKVDVIPVVLYNLQGRFKQFTGGLLVAYKFSDKAGKLVVGSWFKEKDAIAVQVGYEHKIFLVAYSYDFGISRLARTTSGIMTHEVTLGFKLSDIAGKKGIKGAGFL